MDSSDDSEGMREEVREDREEVVNEPVEDNVGDQSDDNRDENSSDKGNESAEKAEANNDVDNSDEDNHQSNKDEENEDAVVTQIFGEMSSDDDDDGSRKEPSEGEKTPPPPTLYFGDEEGQEADEPPPEIRIEVEIPRVVANLGRELNFVKLPNFLSVDTHPYDPQWYEDEIDEEEIHDEEGRARMKLKVENTIRWRSAVDEAGNMRKESNARVVKWSDGSMSLHLGSEIFDVHKQAMTQGDNHLFIRQGTGLQGQAVFKSKLTFRPYSTDSFTHRKMTLSLADRSQKNHQIKVLPTVGKDPEQHRAEMIKKEEDKLKASIRRENKQRRVRERSHARGPSASYLEPDGYDDEDDEAGISLSAIKSQFKQGSNYAHTYTDSDDDGSDLDIGKRPKRAKVVDEDSD